MDTTVQNAQSVQKILKYTYGIVPVVAGLDNLPTFLPGGKTI